MAKSKAKKMREHLARNGTRNPEDFRGERAAISTHVRKSPTLKDKTSRQENKHKMSVLNFA